MNNHQTKNSKYQTFEEYQKAFNSYLDYEAALKCPNPPTPEAIKKAKFVDKTYKWNGR